MNIAIGTKEGELKFMTLGSVISGSGSVIRQEERTILYT
jgi:hypothetical protein